VLAGQLEITVAGQLVTLDEGDSFTFPGSTGHTFQVPPGAGPTRVLWVFSRHCRTPHPGRADRALAGPGEP